MSELLNYVASVQEQDVTPEFDPTYLNKVYYVCKSNYVPPLESFSLTLTPASIAVSEAFTASIADVTPSDADVSGLAYSTSDESIATIDASTGEGAGVAAGTATITATIGDINATADVEVTDEAVVFATNSTSNSISALDAVVWDGSPTIVEIFSEDEISNYTDDPNVVGFFDGGISSVYLVVVDDITDLETLAPTASSAYSLVLASDFAYADFSALNYTFDGLVFFFVQDYETEKAYFAVSKVSGYVSQDTADKSTYKGLTYALGTQLSQSDYTNLQYIKAPYLLVGGVSTKGQGDNLFNDRATFYFADVQYGNVLAGWFAGGLPVTYYLIKETINYELQQKTYTWISDNKPLNTEQERLALQSYLNREVVNFYVDKGYLSDDLKNTLIVNDSDKTYFVDIRPEYVIPNPIWRANIIIQPSTAE